MTEVETDPARVIASIRKARARNSARQMLAGSGWFPGGAPPAILDFEQEQNGYRANAALPRDPRQFLAGTFTPLTPIAPVAINLPATDDEDDERPAPRQREMPPGWNMPVGVPGSEGFKLASFSTLRTYADVYSVARSCIQVRKGEIRGLEWDIMPTEEAEKRMRGDKKAHRDFEERRKVVISFFKKPDPDYLSMGSYLDALMEEMLVTDALSLYLHPTSKKGKGPFGRGLAALELISGSTIRPLVSTRGGRVRPPSPGYQQYLYGVPRVDLMEILLGSDQEEVQQLGKPIAQYRGDQLMYLPYTQRAWTPYGFPPLERTLVPTITGLRKQQYQLNYFDEGTIPGNYISPGEALGWSPNQLQIWQDQQNALAGDPAYKHKSIALPPGSRVFPMRPVALADQFDEIVMVQVCMGYDVMPMEMGISPRVSTTQSPGAANQMAKANKDTSARKTLKPTLAFFSDIFDVIIQVVWQQADMRFVFEGLEENQDENALVERLVQMLSFGLASVDECRLILGKPPWGLPITSDPIFVSQTGGMVPMGSIDPTTGKPMGLPPPAPVGGGLPPAPPGAPGLPPGKPPAPGGPPPATGKPPAASGAVPGTKTPPATPGVGDATGEPPEPQNPRDAIHPDDKVGQALQDAKETHAQVAADLHSDFASGKPMEPPVRPPNNPDGAAPLQRSSKAMLSELDALCRHACKGRDPATWKARHLTGPVLDYFVALCKSFNPNDAAAITHEFIVACFGPPTLAAQIEEVRSGVKTFSTGVPLDSSDGKQGLVPYDLASRSTPIRDQVTCSCSGGKCGCPAWCANCSCRDNGATVDGGVTKAAGKVSRASVNYRKATDPARSCGTCSMIRLNPPDFESHSCTLVEGLIEPADTCDEWARSSASKAGPPKAEATPGRATRDWPAWRYDQELVRLYSAEFSAALPAALSPATIARDWLASQQVVANKVGPKGFEHGWVYVGPGGDSYHLSYHQEDQGERRPRHVIEARTDDGKKVGELNWYGTTGVIHHVGVDEDHSHRGLATAMWQWGQENGKPRPRHSGDRTTQGEAWARSVGGPIPRRNKAVPSLVQAALSWLEAQGWGQKLHDAIGQVLNSLWAEGFAVGQESGKEALDGAYDSAFWDAWHPGDPDAAFLTAGPGLQDMLQGYGIQTIRSVARTRLQELANILADGFGRGDSADAIAKAIEPVLSSPQRALMIATTELARATTLASVDEYRAAHQEAKRWSVTPDERLCPLCKANHDAGAIPIDQPFPSGAPFAPAHPWCRCAILPDDLPDSQIPDLTVIGKVGPHGYVHGWIKVDPAGELAESVRSGVASETTRKATHVVRETTFGNGQTWFHKGADKDTRDAETLASKVSDVLGAGAPSAVARSGRVFTPKVSGDNASDKLGLDDFSVHYTEREARARPYVQSDQGKRIGLLDTITGNSDRTDRNWMVGPGNVPVPIDHSHARYESRPLQNAGRFASQYQASGGNWSLDQWQQWRQELAALAPEYARLGRQDWHAFMMSRFSAEMGRAAKGAGQKVLQTTVGGRTVAGWLGLPGVGTRKFAEKDPERPVSSDGFVAGGLAVRAKNTGRVLMIQRAFDEDDPAGGYWEFPGGRPSSSKENVLDAARREWEEETHLKVPPGKIVSTWESGDYRGHVLEVPDESILPILDRPHGANPDDPDDDQPEAIAWWDPKELKSNPAIRPEIQDHPKRVRQALEDTGDEIGKSGKGMLERLGNSVNVSPRKVYDQLLRNYPAESIQWVLRARWRGPYLVGWNLINDDSMDSWAASHQPEAVDRFAKQIEDGDQPDPVVLVANPKKRNYIDVDGHHRALAYRKLKRPVRAWVGTIDPADRKAMEETHLDQIHEGAHPLNKLALPQTIKVGPKGYIHGWIFVGPGECHDGCGLPTKSKYAPGHDAKHVKALAEAVQSGAITHEQAHAALDHSEKLQSKLASKLGVTAPVHGNPVNPAAVHPAPGESKLEFTSSETGETLKQGEAPGGRTWTTIMKPGGIGSIYHISARSDGTGLQRDLETRFTYLGDGKVQIERKKDGVLQPDMAGPVTMDLLKSGTPFYKAAYDRLLDAHLSAGILAEPKAPKPKPAKASGVAPGDHYGPFKAGNAKQIHDILHNESVPGGDPMDPISHKRYVASRIADRMADVSPAELIAAVYPPGLGDTADRDRYLAAAANPGDYVYKKSGSSIEVHEKSSPFGSVAGYEPLTGRVLKENAASTLIQTWAGTSNDTSRRSLAIQEAAAEEFGLENIAPWNMNPELKADVDAAMAQHGSVYRKFLRAQYDLTQADFKERGITSVNVYRGMKWGTNDIPAWTHDIVTGNKIEAPLFRPLSSWTVNASTASSFAGGGNKRVTLKATVPASAVLSWPRSGFGCLSEYELVVLAGNGSVTVGATSLPQ